MKKIKKDENDQPARLRSNEEFKILESAYAEIIRTVGNRKAESGGILLGSREDFVVQKFVFDQNGSMSAGAYDPDIVFLNGVIKKEWETNKLAFLGFIHSHPRGINRLSGDWGNNTGDIGYMKAIFKAMPDLKKFLVPIMFTPADGGELQFFPFMAYRGEEENYFAGIFKLINDNEYFKSLSMTDKPIYEFDRKRLQGSVNTDLMSRAKVVCVGLGGANGICESLVRSGLGKIVLIDFDEVDSSNIATQGFYMEDIGKLKTVALKERLLRINPAIKIDTYATDFCTIEESDLDKIMYGADLLLMMTDNFNAQAVGNVHGLKYQIPTVFAMMYEKARASEISFTIPGITPACHRCATSSRYNAYLKEGYVNDITSTGSTNFHTSYLNSCIGLISLAILHKETSGYEFSNWFGSSWSNNFIQIRTSPFYESRLFNELTLNNKSIRFFDSVWQQIEPDAPPKYERCPDCGGSGDLRDAYLYHQAV